MKLPIATCPRSQGGIVDYVLKPVDPARLREALERAASLLSLQREASLADRLEGLLAQRVATAPGAVAMPPSERFVVRDGERLSFLELGQIDWFESAGNYVRVHSAGRAYLMRTTMDRVAQRVAAIATLECHGRGAFVVHLRSGAKVISSRYYQPALRRLVQPAGAATR